LAINLIIGFANYQIIFKKLVKLSAIKINSQSGYKLEDIYNKVSRKNFKK
jgi:hypothetical protein